MHHDRLVALAVFADIFKLEARGQIEVELHGRELPQATEHVDQLDIDLWTVKRRFAGDGFVRNILTIQHIFQRADCEFPFVVRTGIALAVFWVPCRELNLEIVKSERRENRLGKVDTCRYFIFDLLRSAEYVSVVLGET